MTALIQDTKRDQLGGPQHPVPPRLGAPVEANTQLFGGGLVATNAAGNAIRPQTAGALNVPGVAHAGQNNLSTNVPYGAAGAKQVEIDVGCFPFATDGSFVAGLLFQSAYAIDDATLSASDAGGSRPYAGYVIQNPLLGGQGTPIYFMIGFANPYGASENSSGQTPFVARCVMTGGIGAYTQAVAGVLVVTATGALIAGDGVTPAVGDVVLLPEGAASITQASDAGYYVVTNAGGTGVEAILTRVSWWEVGEPMPLGKSVSITEGTLFGGQGGWKSDQVKGKVIGTDAPLLYPSQVTQLITMAGTPGVKAVTNVPIRSSSGGTQFVANLKTQAGTSTGIVRYGEVVASTVAGALGTASVTIAGFLAANVENNVADTSTVTLTILQ